MRHLARLAMRPLLVLLLLSALTPVEASRVRPINLEEMTQRANRIFSGRCVNVQVTRDPDLGQTVTYVTFVSHRVEKGNTRGNVTIKILGDQDADSPPGVATDGMPAFRKGEEVILFLYGDSKRGLTSPVGFGQGKFSIVEDKEGRPLAFNQFGNEQLLRDLSPGAHRRLGGRVQRLRGSGGIPPDALLDLVHSLRR